MNAIEINNLNFKYGNGKFNSGFELNIPQWSVAKGEFLSLLGSNGCGKSTLMRLMAGLDYLYTGEIKIEGEKNNETSSKELAKKIAYVPQSYFVYFPFSVYEIVMMGRTPYLNMMGFEKQNDIEIVNESMRLMQIEHLKRKGINELSGGEAQRVFIARAIAQKADILLLDEPNAHLDIEHQILIFNLLQKLNDDQGITLINVSHDLNLVGIFSRKIAFMVDGRIIQHGDKKEMLTQKNIEEIFKINSKVFAYKKSKAVNVLINPR